ncbi:hypothetical protein GQ43DRAFT_393647 [Delitschia confertaspora ATCC 74209]|uniref:Uncharacterized protein n=1 Tax=Delitschia confertaspora ATCC 74209 TaxID=1513339 RepID=A0A9P4JLQ7_9PLEO|nr:hypothetical protein GQ43DRAFT_393647 [Delitschia confertaspora ATCC 74209]
MSFKAISVCKFVGTISLGLLTGISLTHTTLTLPSLLALPSASTAHTSLTTLTSRTKTLSSYLRHITTFSLFSAYLLSPRRFRHPYLLYMVIVSTISGPGIELAMKLKDGNRDAKEEELRLELADLEEGKAGEAVNGERVRGAIERLRVKEGVRSLVAGVAFSMGLVGLWGDAA